MSSLPKAPNIPNKKLDKIVTNLKRSWLLQKFAYTFLLGICFGLVTYWITKWVVLPVLGLLLITALATWLFSRTKPYQNITANKILLHLNRQFSQCEESAQLILLPNSALTTLQLLQKNRIQPKVEALLSTDLRSHLPSYSIKPAILISALVVLSFILIETLPPAVLSTTGSASTQVINDSPKVTKLFRLEATDITVTAPSYTGLEAQKTKDLNLELIAGSTVTWQLLFSGVNLHQDLAIMLPDKQLIPLSKQADNHYQAKATLHHSGVYYIAADEQILSDIHTIAVTADTRPTIRFITPIETIIELTKNAEPTVQASVTIEDDFGLGRVEILASIASGSGEAVKFRDQTFQFDSQSVVEGKTHFIKNWHLTELGMQPGDELYFSIRAWDNRQPAPQQSRSASKIIRWLEDEQQGILADGLVISFIPEYFKSQRQIIIETKELIADKTNLTIKSFNRTSRDLGSAQSALKQKYGQFLGDEVDSGTLQSMEDGPELANDDHQEHGDEPEQSSEHEHEGENHQAEQADKSGYSQIIEQFGHAHGEADDGNFIKKGLPSPKLLMKRAIANMWQAELHLLLSEPELALPFENQALALLNRAKKADRIYVKRLGFEPPPVSEKRRYQGDLSDILSYQRNEKTPEKNAPMQSIVALLNILNQSSVALASAPLTSEQTNIVEQVKAYFSGQLTADPKNISFIATLEKIQQANSFNLINCKDCVSTLREKLWQTLPSPIAAPVTQHPAYSLHNKMLKKYQAFLQQHKKVQKIVQKQELQP